MVIGYSRLIVAEMACVFKLSHSGLVLCNKNPPEMACVCAAINCLAGQSQPTVYLGSAGPALIPVHLLTCFELLRFLP